MDEDWRNAFGSLICDGAGVGICNGAPWTSSSLMIVYLVNVFYAQWPFCLVAMTTLNFKKGIFLNVNLQNH